MFGMATRRVGLGRFKVPIKLFAAGTMLLSITGVAALAPVATTAAHAADPTGAVTPPNDDVYIFNNFANQTSGEVSQVESSLASFPGYKSPKVFESTVTRSVSRRIENGPLSHGSATLTSFTSMAGAGIIVFLTHGVEVKVGLSPIFVEWDGNHDAAYHAYFNYIDHGVDPSWIEVDQEDTFSALPVGFLGISCSTFGAICEWGISLTPLGITHYFGPNHSGLILAAACAGGSESTNFNADAYFGYSSTTNLASVESDTQTLFGALSGQSGFANRNTQGAGSLDYSSGFGLDPSIQQQSMTLAPAVDESGLSPPLDGTLTKGQNTPASVTFDTQMEPSTSKSLVTVSGCGATIEKNSITLSGNTLKFTLEVPSNFEGSNSQATITINHSKAKAASPNFEAKLDGNGGGQSQNFQAPETDYLWHVSCSSICITASGMGSSCGDANSPPGLACVDTGCPTGAINVTVTEPGETAPFTISACCTQNSVILSPSSSAGPNATFTLTNPMYGPSPGCGVVFYFTDTRTNLNLGAAVSIQYCS